MYLPLSVYRQYGHVRFGKNKGHKAGCLNSVYSSFKYLIEKMPSKRSARDADTDGAGKQDSNSNRI